MNSTAFEEQGSILSLLEILLANSPLGFCFLDEDLRYVCVNESFAAMNGFAPGQLLGGTVRGETPEFALMTEAALQRVLLSGQPVLDVELKFAASSTRGETRYALGSFYPILASTGGVASIGAMVLDITDRKTADLRVRESEERYRLLFERSPYPIFVIRPDTGRFLAVNDAAVRNYGYSREEFLIMHVSKLQSDSDVPAFLVDYSHPANSEDGDLVLEGGVQHSRKDGTPIDVEMSWCPIFFRGMSAHLVLAHDTTEQKRAAEKLKLLSSKLARSNTALEQFASVASHDLREPMRTIGMYLELLKRRNVGKLDQESLDCLGFVTDGATRMTELIDDLLKYSKAAASDKEKMPVDLNDVIRTALDNLKIAIGESAARISSDWLPEVTGDSIQLVQLFQNLLANAIKYRQKNLAPEIYVSAEKQERDWLVTVKDNGIGFEMTHAAEIFDQFRRLHARSEYTGSGLGLATCKRVVQQHGGRIWAQSQPGIGSSFFFTIPRDVPEPTGRS